MGNRGRGFGAGPLPVILYQLSIADDLVQETLLRLMVKVRAGQFDPQKGNPRMLAYGIASYVRLEALRRPRYEVISDQLSDENQASPDGQLDRQNQQSQMRAAIRTLSETQQQVLALYLDNELSLQEISQILLLPEGTVKSHLLRAKGALKLLLNAKPEARRE